MEELCQLRGSDIKAHNKTNYFDIKEQEGTQLKNEASNRRIPIHTEVIRLGFLDFAQTKKRNRLFKLEHYKSEKLGHEPSKWFGRLKRGLSFPDTVAFHSFRHTMRDMLSEEDVAGEKIKAILGHDQGDVTFSVYGSDFKPEQLNDCVQILELPNLINLPPFYEKDGH